MKDFKIKYQVVNLMGAVICGLLLASLFAWGSAGDEIKHPCSIDEICFMPYTIIFLYFLKNNLLLCVGSFLVAYVIQLIVSLRYFTKYNGILIGLTGIIIFSLFIFFSIGSFSGGFSLQEILKTISFNVIFGLFFSLVMFLTTLPISVFEKESNLC